MAIRERLGDGSSPQLNGPIGALVPSVGKETQDFQQLKSQMHQDLIERMDLSSLFKLEQAKARTEVRKILKNILGDCKIPLNVHEEERLIKEVEDETFGLGPLEPLLVDDSINDILVNSCKQVYIERYGVLEKTNVVFRDEAHLRHVIERIVSRIGRRIDESMPMVDARLKDGSRVNAIIPPLALNGASVSIRKFRKDPLKVKDLIAYGSIPEDIAELLEMIIKVKLNVIISGGTGSGKTTLLNVLSSFIPENERIVTIEDAAELQLQQDHVVRLETRPANMEGSGAIMARDLVKNALRMRPDRIVVGEVRGAEALDMLQAMNTGHDGSLTTIHSNSARDCIYRLQTMILMAESNMVEWAISRQISSAVNVIIQISRMEDGQRRMMSLSEVTGMEGEVISMQDIVRFERNGVTPEGKIKGAFRFTGVRPRFLDRIISAGLMDRDCNLPEGEVG